MYDANAAFQHGVDAQSRPAVDNLRSVRDKAAQTNEEWEQCREDAVKYLLHELDHIFGTLRTRAAAAGSRKVLVLYHGPCEWFNRISTTFHETWGVAYTDVEMEWVSPLAPATATPLHFIFAFAASSIMILLLSWLIARI
jgi:hypothetical protein